MMALSFSRTWIQRPSASSLETLLEDSLTATKRQAFANFDEIIIPQPMSYVKELMIRIVQSESRGAMALEKQFFGEPLLIQEAKNSSAAFNLGMLLRELAYSAQHMELSLPKSTILCLITDGDDLAHIIVRMKGFQLEKVPKISLSRAWPRRMDNGT
jgi:hypothetical protein